MEPSRMPDYAASASDMDLALKEFDVIRLLEAVTANIADMAAQVERFDERHQDQLCRAVERAAAIARSHTQSELNADRSVVELEEEIQRIERQVHDLNDEVSAMLGDESVALGKVIRKNTEYGETKAYLNGLLAARNLVFPRARQQPANEQAA